MSPTPSNSKYLSKESILDDYLIITTVNKNFLKIFDIWYYYFEKTGYTSILKVITLDKESNDHVLKKNIATIPLEKSSTSFSKIILWRFEVIFDFLKNGKNIIHTDADAIWRDPDLVTLLNKNFDIQVSIAYGIPVRALKKWGFTLCTGFLVLNTSEKLIRFYRDWMIENAEIGDDQIAFNNIFLRSKEDIWGLKSTSFNKGELSEYNLKIQAIDFKIVSRFIENNQPAIFHPYLHSDNQNYKIIDLVKQLDSLEKDAFLNEKLRSVLYNPFGWIHSAFGWLVVKYHKGKRKLRKKISS